jgi:hypothetical protein
MVDVTVIKVLFLTDQTVSYVAIFLRVALGALLLVNVHPVIV